MLLNLHLKIVKKKIEGKKKREKELVDCTNVIIDENGIKKKAKG
ncbi:MAG: hypothetical protein Q8P67_28620 [archaeon]|nr:hypothetical protein [archaeon]